MVLMKLFNGVNSELLATRIVMKFWNASDAPKT